MSHNTNSLANGYYYIRVIGNHEYSIDHKYAHMNFTLNDGDVVIAEIDFDDLLVFANVKDPKAPRRCGSIDLVAGGSTSKLQQFQILGHVPAYAEANENLNEALVIIENLLTMTRDKPGTNKVRVNAASRFLSRFNKEVRHAG